MHIFNRYKRYNRERTTTVFLRSLVVEYHSIFIFSIISKINVIK